MIEGTDASTFDRVLQQSKGSGREFKPASLSAQPLGTISSLDHHWNEARWVRSSLLKKRKEKRSTDRSFSVLSDLVFAYKLVLISEQFASPISGFFAQGRMTNEMVKRSGKTHDYDVIVVGGGSAGVAAAIGAARCGARTALVERYGFLGGAATNAQVLSYCGHYLRGGDSAQLVLGGVANDVLESLGKLGPAITPVRTRTGNWIVLFQPELVKIALDDLAEAAGVDVLMHAMVAGIERNAERLEAVLVADHQGIHQLAADAFVDASGEGDVSAHAGVPMLASAALGSHLQAASFTARIGNIHPAAILDKGALASIVSSIDQPAGGPKLRPDGGFVYDLPGSSERWWMGIDVSTDGVSARDLSRVERQCRRLAWSFVESLRTLPGCERAILISTGPQVGVRESRRPRARYIIKGSQALSGLASATTVARAAWPVEVHTEAGKPTMEPIGGPGWFDVPLEALRAEGVSNLWLAGRLIGADVQANGSVRVMGTAFATGQAAGVAAALSTTHTSQYAAISQALISQGAML